MTTERDSSTPPENPQACANSCPDSWDNDCSGDTCPMCGFCAHHAHEANQQGEGTCLECLADVMAERQRREGSS